FNNREDAENFKSILINRNIFYFIIQFWKDDDELSRTNIVYDTQEIKEINIEQFLEGNIVASNRFYSLTDKDELIDEIIAELIEGQRIYNIRKLPGAYKLYQFLTGDSIDRHKDYRVPRGYSAVYDIIENLPFE